MSSSMAYADCSWGALIGAAGLVLLSGLAFGGEEFALEGTYLRNQICNGDGSEGQRRLVKITPDQIFHADGICSIDDRQREDKSFTLRVSCKFKSGNILSSSIKFTQRDRDTIDMAQQDGSFKAVLYRCRNAEAAAA